ncbi:hypothetical protein [Actinoplanes sp. NBRC 101535]|uniref:hypothetical protein n=1 Tax=Actinoplanes sp. NBRC 101535 TaxID=3032196 RepID=UPI0024A07E7D|nr:hypothetical protein [Actinoplanes sp. NBRC 101535]GLY00687.1 hypothetical protein Acsp01_10660 [Actinoplanes sp. NBRC 101535]
MVEAADLALQPSDVTAGQVAVGIGSQRLVRKIFVLIRDVVGTGWLSTRRCLIIYLRRVGFDAAQPAERVQDRLRRDTMPLRQLPCGRDQHGHQGLGQRDLLPAGEPEDRRGEFRPGAVDLGGTITIVGGGLNAGRFAQNARTRHLVLQLQLYPKQL